MCIELKIKAKHLALEPQIIRKEEERLKKQIKYHRGDDKQYWSLTYKLQELINHRRWNVRNESRATELARAFLAGKMYSTVERRKKCNDAMFFMYIVPRIHAMVTKYGKGDQRKLSREDIWNWSKV